MPRSEQEIMAELSQLLGGGQSAPQQGLPTIKSMGVPSTPNITSRGMIENEPDKIALEVATKKALAPVEVQTDIDKKQAELNQKREVYRKDLGSFLAIDEMIPRGEGFHRFNEGMKSYLEAIGQDTARGKATAVHDAAAKRLRVQLVRAAGDVGNINVVEQQAAEQLIPSIWDSEDVAKTKRAYLRQVGEGIDSNNGDMVVDAINQFMKTKGYDQSKVKVPTKKVNLDEVFV